MKEIQRPGNKRDRFISVKKAFGHVWIVIPRVCLKIHTLASWWRRQKNNSSWQ